MIEGGRDRGRACADGTRPGLALVTRLSGLDLKIRPTLNELSSITLGLLALTPRLDVPLDRSRRRLLELPLAAGRERRLIGRLPPRTASRDRLTR